MFFLKNKTSRALGLLLIPLFIGYYISITCFYHYHLVNGVVIMHSHPYKNAPFNKSPFQSHQHSSEAYYLFQQFNETDWNAPLVVSPIPAPILIYFKTTICLAPTFKINKINSSSQLRAPPFS
jgi:hypothetical protein